MRKIVVMGLALISASGLVAACTPDQPPDTQPPDTPSPTIRLSTGVGGGYTDGDSFQPSISADGQVIAFSSKASNLVPGDTNGIEDVFVFDRGTGSVQRVSVASDGTEAISFVSGFGSSGPSISADGRYVAFFSCAHNLTADDDDNACDVFVHDRDTAETTKVSVASDGTGGSSSSGIPSISADGRYVAFMSLAPNLVPDDTNDASDIFVHDRQTGETSRVSVNSLGEQIVSEDMWPIAFDSPAISGDGRFVTFTTNAATVVADDTNSSNDVFIHDRETGETSRVSVAADGTEGDGDSAGASISSDGRYVAFQSWASNLVAGDNNGQQDVFVRDMYNGDVTRVSVASDGTEGAGYSESPSISSDGRYVAFDSYASNLVPDDLNTLLDIFVHDRQTGTTSRVLVGGSESQSGPSMSPAISATGQFVAFSSRTLNGTPAVDDDFWDIYLYDRGN